MTPSIIGARSASVSGGTSGAPGTVSVPRHPSEQAGDLLLLFGQSFSGGVVLGTLPTPFQAWPTSLPNLAAFSSGKAHQLAGYATSSPPSTYDFPFTASSTRNTILTIVTIRGAHPDITQVISPIVDDRSNSFVSSYTLPTVTGLLTGDLFIRAISGEPATNTAGVVTNTQWNSPLTELQEDTVNGMYVSIATRVMTSDGATGTAPITYIDGSSNPISVTHFGRHFRVVAAPANPVNTVAPAITTDGTPTTGETISCSDGTWTGSPTSFAKQWKRDGNAISGATSSNYTLVVGDEGHSITCTVTATNGAGSVSATSSSVSIPITTAPSNVALPIIVGSPQTGQQLACSSGSWVGGGTISYTYEWRRDGSTVLGSGPNYTLVHADENHAITCVVTATNTAGSVSATSDPVTPAVTAGLALSDIKLKHSGGSGNQNFAADLGGAPGAIVDLTLGDVSLFGPIPGSLAQGGGELFAVLYAENDHPFDTWASCSLFVSQQETHPGLQLLVGVPVQGLNTTVPALTSRTIAPEGITFSAATDRASGLNFGDLPPGSYRGFYVKLKILANTTRNALAKGKVAVAGDPT